MGKLAKVKTTENASSVADFISSVADEQRRKDSFILLKLMQKISNEEPKMWGGSLIGFGKLRYKSPASGREVDWFKIGFSPRKANLSLYFMNLQVHANSLEKLGKHKTGAGCLYINKLDEIDITVLEEMMIATVKDK